MSTSTLLFGLTQSGVKARLWSAWINGDPRSSTNCWDERFSGPEGSIGFQTVPAGATSVYFTKDGYEPLQFDTTMPDDGAKELRLVPTTIPATPLPSIHADGDDFKTDDGHVWKMCFGSNFLLPQLVAEGIDIVPLLYSGLNGYRMFGTSYNPSTQAGFKPFHPDQYPNWAQAIDTTYTILEANGKYGKLDLLCDNNVFGKDTAFLRNLHNQAVEIIRSKKGRFYSLGNENEKNGFNADDFDRPTGVIAACGSGLTGGPAPLSRGKPWDVQYQHLRRDEKMFIDIPPVDATTYWLEHKLLFDETIGFADFNDLGKRTNNADWAYKMGREMSTFNGGVIHLHSGGHSQPLGGQETVCKDAFVQAFGGV